MPQGAEPRSPLYVIPGQVPQFTALPAGCRFADRCAYVTDECRAAPVDLIDAGIDHSARCVRVSELQLVSR